MPVVFHSWSWSFELGVWVVSWVRLGGRSVLWRNRAVHAVSHGHCSGRWSVMRLADDAILAGARDEFPADGGRGRFDQASVGDGRRGAGEVEGHHGQEQPGGVRGEHA